MPKVCVENDVTIHRVGKVRRKRNFLHKMLGHVRFLTSLLIFLRSHSHDFDCIYVSTTPPILAAFCVSIFCNPLSTSTPRMLYHVEDLYPENLELLGVLKTNGFAAKFLKRLDTHSCNSSIAIVTLSTDMVRTLSLGRKNKESENHFVIINNFDMPKGENSKLSGNKYNVTPEETTLHDNGSKLQSKSVRIVYAGNFGPFQNTLFLAKILKNINFENIEFVFAGDGSEYQQFVETATQGKNKITFLGPIEVDDVHELLKTANWAFVTLAERITEVAYPSKTMTYAKIGCPIIAVVDAESELAKLIINDGLGYVFSPGDDEALIRCLILIDDGINKKVQNVATKDRMLGIYNREFSWEVTKSKWGQLLEDIEGSSKKCTEKCKA